MNDDIKNAWLNPGSHPEHHERVKELLRREWPVLYNAIEAAFSKYELEPPFKIPNLPFDIYDTDQRKLTTITSLRYMGDHYIYSTNTLTPHTRVISTESMRRHLLWRAICLGIDTHPWIERKLNISSDPTHPDNAMITLPNREFIPLEVGFEESNAPETYQYLNELYTLDIVGASKKISGAFFNSYDYVSIRQYLEYSTLDKARVSGTVIEYKRRIENFIKTGEKEY